MLLERKTMTNLDSVLKSRDITFLKKVYIVTAMIFPEVMYRCGCWCIKKAEHWRIYGFELWCWSKFLSPLDNKEVKPVYPKGSKVKWSEVTSVVSDSLWPMDCSLPGSSSMGFSRQEYWSGLPFPWIFLTQGSNLVLPHCRQTLYLLSHQGIHQKDWYWSPNNLATWCKELTHWKRPWGWVSLKSRGEGDNGGWDDWIASPTQCMWVWGNWQMVKDRKAWFASVLGVKKRQTLLSDWIHQQHLLTHNISPFM